MSDVKEKLRSLDLFRMPVRWEDVERREPRAISDGSSLEATPRRRVIAAAVAFAVFAAGGWLGWVALGPDRGIRPNVGNDITAGGGDAVLRLTSGRLEPSAELEYGSLRQEGLLEDGCWDQGKGGESVIGCTVDGLWGVEVPSGYVKIPASTTLALEGGAESVELRISTRRYPFRGAEQLTIEGNRAELPASTDRYALVVDADWPRGHATFYLGIEIMEVASTEPAPSTTRYQADSLVLDDPGRPPVLCLGGVADSLPPQCDGIPIADWDWEAVEGEQSAAGSTWGEFHVVGSYDGKTFTLLEAGPPRPPERTEGDPVDTPCAEPEGGWSSPDPSKATDAHLRELMHAVEDEPDFAGFWIDNVVEPAGEGSSEPGNVIANVAFTGDLERHTEQIRELWGGPLCVVEHEHTFAELRRIQRELGEGAAASLGLEATWSDVDVQDNVVELGVVVATAEARAAVEARYGPTAVELHPALEPVP